VHLVNDQDSSLLFKVDVCDSTDCVQNAVHGSVTERAMCELDFMFPSTGPGRRNTACFIDSTCAIIKPHAIRDGEFSIIRPKKFVVSRNMAKNRVGRSDLFSLTVVLNFAN